MKPDPTFNLSALADRLFDENRMLTFAGKIRRSRDLHSLCTDLVMGLESLGALEEQLAIPTDPNDHIKLITESALLNNAIILYVRATKTDSDERGGFDLRSRFNDAQRAIHKELTDLRDKAIAHFGSGGSYGGEWQAELVILQIRGAEARPGVVTRRQTIDRKLLQRMHPQIETALTLLREVYHEKLHEMTDEINKAVRNDPDFHKEIEPHPLNLDVFMKSSDAEDAARASFDTRYAKGSVNHN